MNRLQYAAIFKRIADRLKEPSTHAGLASISLLAGLTIGPGTLDVALNAAAGVFALAAIALADSKVGKK